MEDYFSLQRKKLLMTFKTEYFQKTVNEIWHLNHYLNQHLNKQKLLTYTNSNNKKKTNKSSGFYVKLWNKIVNDETKTWIFNKCCKYPNPSILLKDLYNANGTENEKIKKDINNENVLGKMNFQF